MTDAQVSNSPTFGFLSVVLGFLAFVAVIGHFYAGPLDPPPPIEVSIAEKAASIRDATVAALRGEDYEAKPTPVQRTLDDYLTVGFMVMAAIAILIAVIGFIRHEQWRPGVAGAALAGLAITFQFAITIFFALVCAIVLGAVLGKLDFSFD